MMIHALYRRRAAAKPPAADRQDGLPFGLHPIIDLMKMVGMIAESQLYLVGLIRSLSRALGLLAFLWVLVALHSLLVH